MNRESTFTLVGYGILCSTLVMGAYLLVNAQLMLDSRDKEAQEARRPADIKLTLITPEGCADCTDGSLMLANIEKQDVRITSSRTVSSVSEEGERLIAAHAITRLPAILIDGEHNKQNVSAAMKDLKGRISDSMLVWEANVPVFFDLSEKRSRGLVSITYVKDASCADCYDPVAKFQSTLINGFGIKLQNERTVDIASGEGRALVNTYRLAQVPTFILSSEASVYTALANEWPNVGTKERDGSFVFRVNEAIRPSIYKELTSGSIIRPVASQ